MKRCIQFAVGMLAIIFIVASICVVMTPVQVEAQTWLKGEFSLAVPVHFCLCPSQYNACPCPPPGGERGKWLGSSSKYRKAPALA